MTDTDREQKIKALAKSLRKQAALYAYYAYASPAAAAYATSIVDNPTAHLDALVEAGLLVERTADGYRTPPAPHVCDWRVRDPSNDWCVADGHPGDRWRTVPKRSSREMPKAPEPEVIGKPEGLGGA